MCDGVLISSNCILSPVEELVQVGDSELSKLVLIQTVYSAVIIT